MSNVLTFLTKTIAAIFYLSLFGVIGGFMIAVIVTGFHDVLLGS